jgi:hypothetical protein
MRLLLRVTRAITYCSSRSLRSTINPVKGTRPPQPVENVLKQLFFFALFRNEIQQTRLHARR